MEILHSICAGLDVHQATVTACLRCAGLDGQVQLETRQFATTTKGLLELTDWLVSAHCPVVAMESTGVYWKPVHHILSAHLDMVVGNSRDIRVRRGKKTDKADAQWIAELLAHGLIVPSFVPSPEIAALRDLTRSRVQLVQMRASVKNRIYKILEDTNIKLASVVSDLFGVSGRAMLDALVSGERNAKKLASLAKSSLKKKIPQLEVALEGYFTEHHARLIQQNLEQIDLFSRHIKDLEERINQLLVPLAQPLEQLTSIPGVSTTSASAILGETGPDMSCFVTAGRLASWTKICPGNNESAGKRSSGKTGQGNKYLKRILVQCAWTTRKTETFLGLTFRRLEKRLGGKKAAVAVAHKILVIVFCLLKEGVVYDEQRYSDQERKGEEKRLARAKQILERVGYKIELAQTA